MANNLQFGMILLSSAILLLASLSTCHGKPFVSTENEDRNDLTEMSKGIQQYNQKNQENSMESMDTMDERADDIWNNVPIMPHLSYHNTGNFWPSSSSQSFPPSGVRLPPPRKRFALPENVDNLNSNSLGQLIPTNQQQQVLSNFLSNSGLSSPGISGSGGRANGFPGSAGSGIGPGFRYRPLTYNFRASPNGRLSGYMAPITPRKRQILFRQCFFNPISCF